MAEVKTTRKRRPAKVGLVRPTREELVQRVHDLSLTVTHLNERVQFAEEARASARESSTHLAKELEQVRKERDAGFSARLEVARLEGVLQGLERAGKIEPRSDVMGYDPGFPR